MQECGPCPAPAMASFINILEFMVIVAVWVLVNFVMCSSRLYFIRSPARRCHAQERMCRAITCSQVSEPGIYGHLSGCSTDCQHHVCIFRFAFVTISGIPLRQCQGQPPLVTALPHCAAGAMLSTGRTHCKSCSSPSSPSSILMCAFVWLLF